MKEAVCYLRYSPRRIRKNASGHDKAVMSCEIQLEYCRGYCGLHDYSLIGHHRDEAKSGSSVRRRPGLENALCHAIERKAAFMVYSLSRMARSTGEALMLCKRLEKAGCDLISLHESIDTSSPMGRFTFTVMAALDTLERERTSERTSEAMAARQSAGQRMSLIAPYGYRIDPDSPLSDTGHPTALVRDEAEQFIIRRAIQLRYEGGLTWGKVAEHLNFDQMYNRGGVEWYDARVYKMVRKARMNGHAPRSKPTAT